MGIDSTDRQLLYWLNADPEAFELFYRRHVDRVIGFAVRRLREPADVADVVAATFLTVLTSASSYDGSGEPTAWILGIAARLIANTHRRQAHEDARAAKLAGHRFIDVNDIEWLEDQIDASRAAHDVLAAIDRLKPRAREALLLVGAEGLTPTEAAHALGISPPAFRRRLSNARRLLTKAMADQTPPHHSFATSVTTLSTLKGVTL